MRKVLLLAALILFGHDLRASCTVPTISSPAVSSITTTGATITWNTNTITNALVTYGSPNPGTSSGLFDPSGLMSHTYTITGLIPGTSYDYGIASEAIDTSLRTPCGTGYYAFYDGAGGPGFSTLTATAGTFTSYGLYYIPSPSYVTQGYPIYMAFKPEALAGTYVGNSLTI